MTEDQEPTEDIAEAEDGDSPLPSEFVCPEEAIGMRLDTWLSRLPGSPSRNRVQQLVKDGNVLVNGEHAKRSYEISGGEQVTINWPPPDDDWPWPEEIPLDIIYDDDDVIVLNKQHSLVVHPSAGHPDHTLVNALLYRFPDLPGINGVKRPGIVHRLDRDTTGVMVVAKSERAMNSLGRQLQKRAVSRRYLALVIGDPEWDDIRVEADIGRDPINRLKRAIDGPFPRHAISHFSVVRRSGSFTLIRCRLETGRTHQIRIHLKHIGHPIVCDDTYDGNVKRCLERLRSDEHELKRLFVHFERPWLHAHTLGFYHPTRNDQVSFQAPPPEDAAALARYLYGPEIDEVFGERKAEV